MSRKKRRKNSNKQQPQRKQPVNRRNFAVRSVPASAEVARAKSAQRTEELLGEFSFGIAVSTSYRSYQELSDRIKNFLCLVNQRAIYSLLNSAELNEVNRDIDQRIDQYLDLFDLIPLHQWMVKSSSAYYQDRLSKLLMSGGASRVISYVEKISRFDSRCLMDCPPYEITGNIAKVKFGTHWATFKLSDLMASKLARKPKSTIWVYRDDALGWRIKGEYVANK